ncbi:hypothetical protein CAPTEDRAFT_187939 [Capitella teleta]|uniref:Uncharacterized protein n=1 Tax=Capitella teleta TaxID=283909 RepID=R7U564_CAPTE|nr:hypothetical protein CAPTEDRAFT_187939 [Capitella teleta]|eukprot:ELU01114.1 hypothetical protein CAPTEDRAFT_187939 [Capitella teleta]
MQGGTAVLEMREDHVPILPPGCHRGPSRPRRPRIDPSHHSPLMMLNFCKTKANIVELIKECLPLLMGCMEFRVQDQAPRNLGLFQEFRYMYREKSSKGPELATGIGG